MDPDPGKEIEVDPERGLKWIRIRQNAVDPDPDPDPKRWIIASISDLFVRSSIIYLFI